MSSSRPGDATYPWISLRSAHIPLRGDQILADQALLDLVIEDLCWEIALADLMARVPARWQWRRMARWGAEHALLAERADQLRELARAHGIQV